MLHPASNSNCPPLLSSDPLNQACLLDLVLLSAPLPNPTIGDAGFLANPGRSMSVESDHSDDNTAPLTAIGTRILDEKFSASADVPVPNLSRQQRDTLLPFGGRSLETAAYLSTTVCSRPKPAMRVADTSDSNSKENGHIDERFCPG